MKDKGPKKTSMWKWPRYVSGCLLVLLVPWCLILTYHPRFALKASESAVVPTDSGSIKTENTDSAIKVVTEPKVTIVKVVPETKVATVKIPKTKTTYPETEVATIIVDSEPKITPKAKTNHHLDNVIVYGSDRFTVDGDSKMIKSATPPSKTVTWDLHKDAPLLGPMPTKGISPLYGVKHQGGDAIFALACNYPKASYQRFVGSLRKFGYNGDIVLAVSPPTKMLPGVAEYVKKTGIVAYGFEVDCAGTDDCKLKDEFLGYPDPRPHRTFANIRYALYEYWLRQYSEQSYILILDFRDTFFQGNPFGALAPVAQRKPTYDLRMFAENYKVKNIGICVFNSMWVEQCFGTPALENIKSEAVICSGSTMGSYQSIYLYVKTMLKSMDTVKCWLKKIESDQGYQNYLFYNGHFNTDKGNATLFLQGDGVVNTIGALNGFRVPAEMKGPLDTHWKIRDKQGYILNNDGTKSVCVHQWDRWEDELIKFVDSKLYDP